MQKKEALKLGFTYTDTFKQPEQHELGKEFLKRKRMLTNPVSDGVHK
jgi:hypothetical protein